MPVTPEELRGHIGGKPADDATLATDLAEAAEMLAAYASGNAVHDPECGSWTVDGTKVPPLTMDRALREVGADLFHRRKAPNGVQQQQYGDGFDQVPIRINRDPLTAAYKLLGRWVVPF